MVREVRTLLVSALLLLLFACSRKAGFASVDLKNANYSDVFVDIGAGEGNDAMKVERGYNSRTLYDGIFGFAWCSDFESTLRALPDGRLRYSECGAGEEIGFGPDDSTSKGSPRIRYRAIGSTGEIVLRDGHYVMSRGVAPARSIQEFDSSGRYLSKTDPDGLSWLLRYDGSLLKSVTDNRGNKLSFEYYSSGKVKRVTRSDGQHSEYKYTIVGDLSSAQTASGHIFKYEYDQLHDLTRLDFPDGKWKEMTYNTDMDWIIRFRDINGCVEKYDYNGAAKNPRHHFWASASQECHGVWQNDRYEFWYAPRTEGNPNGQSAFLSRSVSVVGADVVEITYDENGLPTAIIRNGIKRVMTVDASGHSVPANSMTNIVLPSVEVKTIQISK